MWICSVADGVGEEGEGGEEGGGGEEGEGGEEEEDVGEGGEEDASELQQEVADLQEEVPNISSEMAVGGADLGGGEESSDDEVEGRRLVQRIVCVH